MKDKILHIELLVAVFIAAFFIGRNTVETTVETKETDVTETVNKIEVMKMEDVIKLLNSALNKEYVNIYDITGWEYWEADGKVNLEIEDWIISKEPYTLNATFTKIEE